MIEISNTQKKELIGFFFVLFAIGTTGYYVFPTDVIKTYNQYTTTIDGVNICYDVFEPKNNNSVKKGIILGHGVSINKESLRLIAIDLAQQGFVAIPFDFRGHGRSGGNLNFQAENMNGLNFGSQEAQTNGGFNKLVYDILAIKWVLGNRTDIDMHNLGYVGYSMGGGAGFELCFNDNDFNAMVGLAPVPDYMRTNITNPRNLLLIVGKYDEAIQYNLLLKVAENKTGVSEEIIKQQLAINGSWDYNEGKFSNGTAARVYIDNNSDHLIAPYDQDFVREIRRWFMISLLNDENYLKISFHTYENQFIFIIISILGGISLFLAVSNEILDKIKSKNDNDKESKNYKDDNESKNNKDDNKSKNNKDDNETKNYNNKITEILTNIKNSRSNYYFQKKFLLITIILSYPCIVFGLPIFLAPLIFSNMILMIIMGMSMSIYFFMRHIIKSDNGEIKKWYDYLFKRVQTKEVLMAFILGIILWIIMSLNFGNLIGIIPGLEKSIWLFVYFPIIFIIFLNIDIFAYLVYLKNQRDIKISIIESFLLISALISILILIPSFISGQFFFAIILILAIPIFLLVTGFTIFFCYKIDNPIIPTIIISILLTMILVTISPILSLFSFL